MMRIFKLAASALVAAALAAAAAPWRVPRAAVGKAFADGLPGQDAGMSAVAAGRVTFKLLPRPRLQAAGLTASAEGGAILLDAPLLKAELDIPSLLRGVWRMSSATLVEPTLTVDVDRLTARTAPARPPVTSVRGAPVMLHLRSGLLKTHSATGLADLLATGIDASASWSGHGDDLAVSGTATLRGTTAQFTGTVQHAGLSLTAAGSPASLQVESPLFDFSADGVLSGGPQAQFAGRASFGAPSLPRFLRILDDAPASLPARHAQVGGNLVARFDDLSLSDAQIRLDQTRFEGSLAWRREGGRGLVAGTLATEALDLKALAGDSADASGIDELYRRMITSPSFAADVDVRISATTARLGRVTLEDAAFATLVRGDRLELALDEARAYGGLLKARAVLRLGQGGIGAHAEISAKHVDLGLLSDGLSGRARLGGLMTVRAAVDGQGSSLRDVVADLAGEGQVGVDGVRVSGLSLSQVLRRSDRRGPATVFDGAQWDVSIRDGMMRIPDGKLTAPGIALTFGATTGLPDGRVDFHAVAVQTEAAGAPMHGGATVPFDLRGFWTGPLTLVGSQGGLPGVALPLRDGIAAER